MNEFRKKLRGIAPAEASLLRTKSGKAVPSTAAEQESFSELVIPRSSGRCANHRDGDRHRLQQEDALLLQDGASTPVTLVNLSGGGAMIEGAGELMLWDKVELQLGGASRVEAIVRWVRSGRVGLEFAHETRIEAEADEVAETLRQVIRRSFPDVALEAEAALARPVADPQPQSEPQSSDPAAREELAERELRHPLIWSGQVHYNHDSTSVRLRNISSGGALIESSGAFPLGAELLLDLGEGGLIFGTVHWANGDQVGLRFHKPFDLASLAKVRPEIAGSRWTAPDYLREDRSSSSPWSAQWGRSDLAGVHRALELRRSRIRKG